MKLLSALLAISALFVVCETSALSFPSVNPYVGADASFQIMNPKNKTALVKQDQYLPGANVYAGVKLNQYLGAEVGGVFQKSKKLSGSTFKTGSFHISAIGRLPVASDISLLGGVGLSHLKYTYTQTTNKTTVSKTVPRLMGGVEYTIVDNLNLRGTLIYQHTSNIEVNGIHPNDSCFASFGLNYSF
jgi:OOP family OmpA-OmpF porin